MFTIKRVRTPKGDKHRLDYRDLENVRHRPLFDTREEAEDEARRVVPTRRQRRERRAAIAAGYQPAPTAGRSLTLGEWARGWLVEIRGTVKRRTFDAYRRAVELVIIPELGDVPLTALRPGMLRRMLADYRANGRRPPAGKPAPIIPKPLAANSVRLVFAPLHAMLEAAVDSDETDLEQNPAIGLAARRRLKLHRTAEERRKYTALRVLAPETLEAWLEWVAREKPKWLALVLTFACSGLRLGEILALELDDFDPVARGGGTFHVRQAFDEQTGRLDFMDEPKNGPRVVSLAVSPRLVLVLMDHVRDIRPLLAKAGTRWLFPTRNGTHYLPRNVQRAIAILGRQGGLKRPLSPQDFRRTYATRLAEQGAPAQHIQQQLGHASPHITLDVYASAARPALPTDLVGLFDGQPGDPAAAAAADAATRETCAPPRRCPPARGRGGIRGTVPAAARARSGHKMDTGN